MHTRFSKLLCRLSILCAVAFTPRVWALDFDEARHLLLRAGFGPERELVGQLTPLSRRAAVDLLIGKPMPALQVPDCVDSPMASPRELRAWEPPRRKAYRNRQKRCRHLLRNWYAQQLIDSDAVLRQQMTLFWHNHFTSSLQKVREPRLIAGQHRLLYTQALGRFDALLLAVVRDPAMLIYLDNVNNRRLRPNENLARELLELFTMGEGHYSEQDIREAARALTGLSVDPATGKSRFYPRRHDRGLKAIFGVSGHFNSRQLVELILRQPATAEYVTRRIWLHFVSEPDEALIRQLAARFRQDWDIAQLVRDVLLSTPFWRDQGRMIKSPVELLVGNVRLFGMVPGEPRQAVRLLRWMGQDLLDPPSVKGWAVDEWMEPGRMLVRINVGERLVRGFGGEAMASRTQYLCDEHGPLAFTAIPPLTDAEEGAGCQQQLEALVGDAVWQLK